MIYVKSHKTENKGCKNPLFFCLFFVAILRLRFTKKYNYITKIFRAIFKTNLCKNIIILKLCQNFWNCHTIWIAWKFGHLHTTFILWQNTQHEYYIHTCFFLWLFIHCVTFYTFYSFCCFITIVSKKPQYNYICVLSTKTTQKAFLCIYTHVVE